MLEVRSLSRRFPGRAEAALSDVSFTVPAGQCVVVSGANGSGKSVLMNLIAGLDRPTSGEVRLPERDGKPVRVGLVFQDADAQILGDTVGEDARFGPLNLGLSQAEAAAVASRSLAEVGLAGREDVPSRALSGGEKRRLAIAGILAMEAPILILDEPYANLDWPGVTQVNALIERLKADGKTLIILTHELEKILALADRLLVLYRGRLVLDATPDAALRDAPLADWGIRQPLGAYESAKDLLWR